MIFLCHLFRRFLRYTPLKLKVFDRPAKYTCMSVSKSSIYVNVSKLAWSSLLGFYVCLYNVIHRLSLYIIHFSSPYLMNSIANSGIGVQVNRHFLFLTACHSIYPPTAHPIGFLLQFFLVFLSLFIV